MDPKHLKDSLEDRQLAIRVIDAATPTERDLIAKWAQQLIEIRDSDLSVYEKAKQAITVSVSSDALVPLIKTAGLELKRVGWDDRGWAARLGGSGVIAGVLLFSGQGAGIAALGGAIGVPLWVVFGAGGAFAGQIIDAAKQSHEPHDTSSPNEPREIEGEVIEKKHDGA